MRCTNPRATRPGFWSNELAFRGLFSSLRRRSRNKCGVRKGVAVTSPGGVDKSSGMRVQTVTAACHVAMGCDATMGCKGSGAGWTTAASHPLREISRRASWRVVLCMIFQGLVFSRHSKDLWDAFRANYLTILHKEGISIGDNVSVYSFSVSRVLGD